MEPVIRAITPDEYPAYSRTISRAFGEPLLTPEQVADYGQTFAYDRGFAAFDGDRIVATIDGLTFALTLPGLAAIPVGGITGVGVLPTHRRRGLLRHLMARELDTIAAKGEAVAILTASESGIYGRFGFGCATDAINVEIDRHAAAFARPITAAGEIALIDAEEAATLLPALYDRVRQQQPGALTRSPEQWARRIRSFSQERDGASAMYIACYTAGGVVEGVALYRIKEHWEHGLPNNTVLLREIIASTPAATTALWHFCLNIDLTNRLQAQLRPVDEPLRWQLADPRRLRVTRLSDFLWVRLLDLPRALTARRYATTDRLVLAVDDPFRPVNSGVYLLDGGPDGATCRRTDVAPDLRCDIADLGAAYLGGVRFSTLVRAGRVAECTPGAATRADLFFHSDPAPFCSTPF